MAATVALSPSTPLQPGQNYTFFFNVSDINPFVQPSDIVSDILNHIDYVTNVNVNQGVGPYFVQLLYQGDATDTIDSLASDIENVVNSNHTLFTFSFQSASTGAQEAGTIGSAGKVLKQEATDTGLVPDTSTLVIVVIGIALVVFVLSGGPQIVREATA